MRRIASEADTGTGYPASRLKQGALALHPARTDLLQAVDGEFLIKSLPVSGAAHDSAGSTDDERGPLDQEAAHQIHQTACDPRARNGPGNRCSILRSPPTCHKVISIPEQHLIQMLATNRSNPAFNKLVRDRKIGNGLEEQDSSVVLSDWP